MTFRRIPADVIPDTRTVYSLNDEGIRTFRGIAWALLLSIPLWAGVLWIGQKLFAYFSGLG